MKAAFHVTVGRCDGPVCVYVCRYAVPARGRESGANEATARVATGMPVGGSARYTHRQYADRVRAGCII